MTRHGFGKNDKTRKSMGRNQLNKESESSSNVLSSSNIDYSSDSDDSVQN